MIGIVLLVAALAGLILHRVHAIRKDGHRAARQAASQNGASAPEPAAHSASRWPRTGDGDGNGGSGRSGGAHRR